MGLNKILEARVSTSRGSRGEGGLTRESSGTTGETGIISLFLSTSLYTSSRSPIRGLEGHGRGGVVGRHGGLHRCYETVHRRSVGISCFDL